jgi:hypothetical protein
MSLITPEIVSNPLKSLVLEVRMLTYSLLSPAPTKLREYLTLNVALVPDTVNWLVCPPTKVAPLAASMVMFAGRYVPTLN